MDVFAWRGGTARWLTYRLMVCTSLAGTITGRMTARVRFSARMISTTAWEVKRRGRHSATEVGLRTAAAAAAEEEEVREVRDGGASPR